MFRYANIPSSTNSINDDICSVPIKDSFTFRCVSQLEVMSSFRSIKSKATGIDGLNTRFFKILLSTLLPYVTHVFNTALVKLTFPDEWRKSKIAPIPKQQQRLISILTFLSKVIENIVSEQINEYVRNHNIWCAFQSGFMKGMAALTDVVEDLRFISWWMEIIKNGSNT